MLYSVDLCSVEETEDGFMVFDSVDGSGDDEDILSGA